MITKVDQIQLLILNKQKMNKVKNYMEIMIDFGIHPPYKWVNNLIIKLQQLDKNIQNILKMDSQEVEKFHQNNQNLESIILLIKINMDWVEMYQWKR